MTREEALNKYSNCYLGHNPDNYLTITVGREVCDRLKREGFEVEGPFANPTSQTTGVNMIPVEGMISDGFPTDFPLTLVVRGPDNWHSARMCLKWMNSGLWNWGLKWAMKWGW